MQKKIDAPILLRDILQKFETGNPGEIRSAGRELKKILRDELDPAEPFTPLRELVLKAIQHPEESVRDVAIAIGAWLNEALRARSRGKSTRAGVVEEYHEYVRAIELLIDYYDNNDERDADAEFIDEMPSSPQKSLEMLLDLVTHGGYELEITHVAPPDILARREKLETEIARLLDEAKSNFCFHDVIERIYYEDPSENFGGIIASIIDMFEGEVDNDNVDEVVAVVNDAWNYFPHASLNGLCPAEKMPHKH